MSSLSGKIAVVVGASSGVGKATTLALMASGARVTAVARGSEGLRALVDQAPAGLEVVQADATDPQVAERLVRELRPDLLVLSNGTPTQMAPFDEFTWEGFSQPWNTDLKASFHFLKAALSLPLKPGSTVVLLSSGAAIQGSHLSGGYAGAKRMQWLLAGYAQKRSDAQKLGIRAIAVIPKQLIVGTAIAEIASSTYGASLGVTAQEYMKRFEVPLDSDKVAAAILGALQGSVAREVTAIGVTGSGVESMA